MKKLTHPATGYPDYSCRASFSMPVNVTTAFGTCPAAPQHLSHCSGRWLLLAERFTTLRARIGSYLHVKSRHPICGSNHYNGANNPTDKP